MIDVRALSEPQWPYGGFATRRFGDRNWAVQQYTGYPVSNVPAGAWERGAIIRKYQPPFRPPSLGLVAYDPTRPDTWRGGGN